MMSFYIWSFTLYSDILSSGYTCDTSYVGNSICKNSYKTNSFLVLISTKSFKFVGSRIALDSLFLIYGFVALCMNTILIHDAKWIEPRTKPNAPTVGDMAMRNIPVVVTISPVDHTGQNYTR